MRALLAHSAARGLGLTAEHLLFGAADAEIAAILAARAAATPSGDLSPEPADPATAGGATEAGEGGGGDCAAAPSVQTRPAEAA
jgi:hypothetical protein